MYRGVITMAVLRVGEPLGNHPTHEFLQKDFLKSLLDLIYSQSRNFNDHLTNRFIGHFWMIEIWSQDTMSIPDTRNRIFQRISIKSTSLLIQ